MPDSPSQRDPDPPPPHDPPQPSSAQLAALLADALKDADALRRELQLAKKRADDLERRYHALAALSDPKSPHADTARIIHDFEQRAVDAEAARDDSESRRRLVLESWHQLDRYFQTVELRAADARAGFAKIIADGAPAPLVLASIPLPGGLLPYAYPAPGSMPPPHNHASRTPYPTGRPSPHGHRSSQSFPMALPPHPAPNANGRRPREESTDRSGFVDALPGQPPSKKLKGFGDDRRGRDERAAYSESNLAYMHQRHQPLPPQAIEARERIYQEQQRRLPQARMIVPPAGGDQPEYPNHRTRSRSRSRSSSRSSRSSWSVDEMLLEAANGNGGTPGSAGDAASQRSHRRRHHREDPSHQRYPSSSEPTLHSIQQQQQPQQQPPQQQHNPPSSQQRPQGDSPPPQTLIHNYRPRAPHASASVPLVTENHVGAMPAPCHVQTIQTHVFAPVVTGAPQKKNKFSASGGSVGNLTTAGTGSPDAPPPTPQHVYPPMNTQGQRICRQCGMPGRYKEGKCVEKWGPGPMGPGTVCDRCRKKMKRVERRGNLESQQLSASNSLSSIAPLHQPPPHPSHGAHGHPQQQPQQTQPVPPRNVLQQSQSVPSVTSSDRGIHRTDTLVTTTVPHPGPQQLTPSGYRDDSDARSALVAAVSSTSTTKAVVAGNNTATVVNNHGNGNGRVPLSPPPAIASINDELPVSNVGRGAGGGASATVSRGAAVPGGGGRGGGSSRNTNDRSRVGGVSPSKRSPLGSGGSRTSSMDMDADGDADADADAEAEGEGDADVEGEGEGGEGDDEGTADVDAEIEDAVAVASSAGGGGAEAETDADDEILDAIDSGGRR